MDSASAPKSPLARLLARLAASRFFTFSLLLHAIVIILAGSIILVVERPEPPDVPIIRPFKDLLPPETPQTETPAGLLPDFATAPAPPAPSPISTISTTSSTPAAMQQASLPSSLKQGRALNDLLDGSRNLSAKLGNVGVPSGMLGRLTAGTRGKGLGDHGGTTDSEKAVLAGLRWLKEHQEPDGSWSPGEFTPSMTGLALLCFLGHGELPTSPEFGSSVNRALDWVLAKAKASQGKMGPIEGGNSGVYEHAILTYAMGEYVAMTHDERFLEVFKQAIGYIVQGQTAQGGWDYRYSKAGRNDLSVAGWQIQALKAAHLADLKLPGVDAALDKSMTFLKQFQGNEGGFGYVSPENRWSLTGVGVLCTYFWKGKKDEVVKDGMAYLLGGATDVQYKSEKADLYAWYYDGQACLMFGEPAWSKWNRLFQSELCRNQSPDGSWPVMVSKGHGNFQQKATGAGPFYRTTLCVLMLEVYYRYMATNR